MADVRLEMTGRALAVATRLQEALEARGLAFSEVDTSNPGCLGYYYVSHAAHDRAYLRLDIDFDQDAVRRDWTVTVGVTLCLNKEADRRITVSYDAAEGAWSSWKETDEGATSEEDEFIRMWPEGNQSEDVALLAFRNMVTRFLKHAR